MEFHIKKKVKVIDKEFKAEIEKVKWMIMMREEENIRLQNEIQTIIEALKYMEYARPTPY